MRFQKNVSLKNYTTFKIGGSARYFCLAKSKDDLIKAVDFAKKEKLPFFILGGGSKLLISDNGFDGLVVKIHNLQFKIQIHNSKFTIICGAGLSLAELISKTSEIGASGIEWAAGIPGATVGGAIRGNAGAFRVEMKDIVKSVEVFDVESGEVKIFENKDCRFGYRESIFKKSSDLIVLSCELKFKKEKKEKVKAKVREILNYRKSHHPFHASAGSVFKNIESTPTAILIHRCGLTGKRIGMAQISKKHSNFIINLGGAKAKDVLKLIDLAKKEVKNKFGIVIEEEIQFLGKF